MLLTLGHWCVVHWSVVGFCWNSKLNIPFPETLYYVSQPGANTDQRGEFLSIQI